MGLVVESANGDSFYLSILSAIDYGSHIFCECRLYDSYIYSRLGARELGVRSFRIPRDSLSDFSFSECYTWLRSFFSVGGNRVVDV